MESSENICCYWSSRHRYHAEQQLFEMKIPNQPCCCQPRPKRSVMTESGKLFLSMFLKLQGKTVGRFPWWAGSGQADYGTRADYGVAVYRACARHAWTEK